MSNTRTDAVALLTETINRLLAEIILLRDETYDCATNFEGEYGAGPDADDDCAEVARLDALIDDAQAAVKAAQERGIGPVS